MTIHLAGIPIRDEAVLESGEDGFALVDFEGQDPGTAAVRAVELRSEVGVVDEAGELEDAPPDLTELRGVLLREMARLRSEGIT